MIIYPNTDVGMGRRLRDEWAGSVRYSQELGRWLIKEGGVWKPETGKESQSCVLDVCLRQEEDAEGRGEQRPFLTRANFIKQVLFHGQAFLSVKLSEFDSDPWLLNTPEGPVDLRSGYASDMHNNALFMQSCCINPLGYWTPEVTPKWSAHIRRMCKGDIEVGAFLKRLAGMTLIGDQNLKHHIAPQLNGLGRNGKGVFLQGLAYALGDYAQFASTRLLTTTENAHTTEQAGLRGMRLVVVEEVKRINSSVLKDLTGGGVLRARRMRADDEEFLKSWTLWFNNNGPMMFSGDVSDGLWQRVPRIDFGVGIPEDERVDDMAVQLREEAAGILAWAVEGCLEYQQIGLCIPQSVKDNTAERRADADPLHLFVDERYDRDYGAKVLGSKFMDEYTDWCRNSSEANPGGRKTVFDQLRTQLGLTIRPGTANKTFIYGLKERPLELAEYYIPDRQN